jgi:hypothetical protein
MATRKYRRKSLSLKKGGDNSKTKKCLDTKCKLFLEESEKRFMIFKKKLEKNYKEGLVKLKKVCETNPKNKDACETQTSQLNIIKKMIDSSSKKSTIAKGKKLDLNICKKQFCNEGCIETILEDGPADTLPKSILVKYKKYPDMLKMFQNMRKEVFGKKTSVLNDSFFEGMKPAEITKYKKEGAISGCIKR